MIISLWKESAYEKHQTWPGSIGHGSYGLDYCGYFWNFLDHCCFFFPLFGVLFIIMGIVQAVYNFKNATGEHRFSEFDIVDGAEEPDPLERRFHSEGPESSAYRFCPYCGARLGAEFEFCGKCGRRLPDDQ